MLAIRMQRTGRKGLPNYRIVVQDSRRTPLSGRVVAQLGSYNPHTKQLVLDKDKAQTYLNNGAQPSDRVVKLLLAEKIELPAWVKVPANDKQKTIRNAEKLRRNQPKEEAVAEDVATETVAPNTSAEEAPVEVTEEA